jgi:NADH-quinone oxidoreductase subunit G
VIAHESVLTDTVRDHIDIVIPAEAYPEKEGTLVHPDGRVQRLRPAIGRPKGAQATWQVLAEIASRAGSPHRILAGPIASKQLFEAVPFYRGLTLDAIGGRGVRWPQTDAASAYEAEEWNPVKLKTPKAAPAARNGSLRLGTFRTLWASKEVDVSPVLQFAIPKQVVELSPADADRLGIQHGEAVEVASNGHRVHGAAVVRAAVPAGSVFLAEGVHDSPGNAITASVVEVRGMQEFVEEMPVPMGGSGQQAEQAAAGSPSEDPDVGARDAAGDLDDSAAGGTDPETPGATA